MFVSSKVHSVFVIVSLVLLANAQKQSSSADVRELSRQNKITQQILEAYIQKKLGLASTNVRAPSIFDILPAKKTDDRPIRESATNNSMNTTELKYNDDEVSEVQEVQYYGEDDNLQTVESEQIDSIYSEGRSKKYIGQTFENELEPGYHPLKTVPIGKELHPETDKLIAANVIMSPNDCSSCNDEDLGVTRWTMPLLKSGEKRYYLGIFFKANWFKAQQYCRFHGMHLASISTQEENDRLEKYVRESGYGREHFWTSGTDLAEEGNFFWLANGRPLTFVNWNAGEPNNFRYENGEEENCLELWNRDDKGLKWNDSPCSFETFFICEVRTD